MRKTNRKDDGNVEREAAIFNTRVHESEEIIADVAVRGEALVRKAAV